MGINVKNVAAYIHGQAPGKLDGLFHAVEAKCKELDIKQGSSKDNVAGGDGSAVGGNVRGILNYVAGIEKITDEDTTTIVESADDQPAEGDSKVVAAEKANRRAAVPEQENARKLRLAAKQADHKNLQKIYTTLLARFAAAGYKPKPQPAALV